MPARAALERAGRVGRRVWGRELTVLALLPLCCPADQLSASRPTAPTPCTRAASVQGDRPCAKSQSFATWRARAKSDLDRRTAKRRSAGSEVALLLHSWRQRAI